MDISNSNFKGKFVRQFRRLANKTKLEANKELGIHAIELIRSDVVVNFSYFLLSRPSLLIFPSYISPFNLFHFLPIPFFYVTNG